MLQRITIKNIRSIEDSEFPIKKLNVFIGKNSSGKSSILSALLGLRALAIGQNSLPQPFINFEGLHRKGTEELMEVWISGLEILPLPSGTTIIEDLQPSLKVRILESGTYLSWFVVEGALPEVSVITVSGVSGDVKTEILQTSLLSPLFDRIEKKYRDLIQKQFARTPFEGYSYLVGSEDQDITHKDGRVKLLGFEYTPYTREPTASEQLALSGMKQYHNYLSNMVYISVTRGFLQSYYQLRDELVHNLTGDAVHPEEILNIQAYGDHRNQKATESMKKWASVFGIEDFETEIQPRRRIDGRGWISAGEKKEPLPVSSYGFGSNQFLTVIAKCVFAPKRAPILIEEPEIHLHPEMQAEATDFLIEMMKADHQLFITTHSEHLIARIQRRLADRSLTPKEVGIFWVQFNQEKGTAVEEVPLNEDGIFHEELKTYMDFLEKEVSATQDARRQNREKEG